MSENLSVTLSPEKLHVTPGGSVEAVATIRNVGDVVEAYSIEIEGIEPQWVTLSVLSASLFPGDEAQVHLGIQLPRTSVVKAGRYEVRLKVISKRDPSVQSTVEVALDVEGFLLFDVDLAPRKARGRKGSYQVKVTNSGNLKTTYTIAGQDPDETWEFNVKQENIVVEPGATAEVPVVVKPRKSILAGRPKTRAFNLTVTPHAAGVSDAKPKTVEAQLESLPVVPIWAIAVAAVALIAIIAVIIVVAMSKPPDEEAPAVALADFGAVTDDRPVTINAESDASDLRKIQIFLNGELKKECDSSPCVYTTENMFTKGTVLDLGVVAYDKSGNEGRIDRQVEVMAADPNPPVAEVKATLESEVSLGSGDRGAREYVKFVSTAEDESGLQSIEVFVKSGEGAFASIGEAGDSSPYEIVGGPYEEGSVQYYVRALDTVGNEATTEVQQIVIPNRPPVVEVIITPEEPTTDDIVKFEVRAKDFGGVERIEIFFRGVKFKECEGAALGNDGEWFTCERSGGPYGEGTYEYWAFAYDNENARGASGRLEFTVAAP